VGHHEYDDSHTYQKGDTRDRRNRPAIGNRGILIFGKQAGGAAVT
jgi:hypothetical protein